MCRRAVRKQAKDPGFRAKISGLRKEGGGSSARLDAFSNDTVGARGVGVGGLRAAYANTWLAAGSHVAVFPIICLTSCFRIRYYFLLLVYFPTPTPIEIQFPTPAPIEWVLWLTTRLPYNPVLARGARRFVVQC